jgi:hypothetical protein
MPEVELRPLSQGAGQRAFRWPAPCAVAARTFVSLQSSVTHLPVQSVTRFTGPDHP